MFAKIKASNHSPFMLRFSALALSTMESFHDPSASRNPSKISTMNHEPVVHGRNIPILSHMVLWKNHPIPNGVVYVTIRYDSYNQPVSLRVIVSGQAIYGANMKKYQPFGDGLNIPPRTAWWWLAVYTTRNLVAQKVQLTKLIASILTEIFLASLPIYC